MQQILHKACVIALQETHSLQGVKAPNFHQVYSSSWKHPKRGVALLLHQASFGPPTIVARDELGSQVWATATYLASGTEWLFGCLHLFGLPVSDQLIDCREIAHFLHSQPTTRPTIVMGDFNIHLSAREAELISRSHRLTGREGENGVISKLLRDSDLILRTRRQVEFTHAYGVGSRKAWSKKKRREEARKPIAGRKGLGWIDYILVSPDVDKLSLGMEIDHQIVWSDHLPIFSSVDFGARPPPLVRWKKISPAAVQSAAPALSFELAKASDPSIVPDSLERFLQTSDKAICTALQRPLWTQGGPPPRRHGWWFAGELQRTWRHARSLQWEWRKAVDQSRSRGYVISLRNRWRLAKDVLDLAIAKEREKCWLGLMGEMEVARLRHPARFAQIVKTLTGRNRSPPTPAIIDPVSKKWKVGKAATDQIRETLVRPITLNQEFWSSEKIEQISRRAEETLTSIPADKRLRMDTDMGAEISEEELIWAAKTGRTGSSPGLSGWTLPLWRLAISQDSWRATFTRLLNLAIQSNSLPAHWKKVRLIAIPKQGTIASSPSDWRGISLLDLGYKMMAKILQHRLAAALVKVGNLRPSQFGFEAGKSSGLAYLTLAEVYDRRADRRQASWIAFLDVSKAFDSVSPWVLRLALAYAGLDLPFQNLVCNMYFPTEILDFDPDVHLEANCGVRQGCPLAPALFNLVIDMLSDHLELGPKAVIPDTGLAVNQIWYADDCALIADSQSNLQALVDRSGRWLQDHGLSLNVKKCKVLSNASETSRIQWGGTPMERVSSFSYLGLPFGEEFPREKVVSARFAATAAACQTLQRHLVHNKSLNVGLKVAASRPLVEGTLYFNCETWMWDGQMMDKVDRFISGLSRRILSLNFDGGSWAGAIAEMGIRVPSIEAKRRALLTFWRLLNDPRISSIHLAKLLKREWPTPSHAPPPGFRSDGTSWMARVARWIRTSGLAPLVTSSSVEMHSRIQAASFEVLKSGSFVVGPQPHGMSNVANRDYQIRYFSTYRPMPNEISLLPPPLLVGCQAWSALRVGSFRFSKRWNWLFGNKTSDHTCCACREADEDTDHLLWHCKAWRRLRVNFVAQMSAAVGSLRWRNSDDKAKSTFALGGLSDLPNKTVLKCAYASILFLNSVSRIRDIIVGIWGSRMKRVVRV